ncbi:MAG: hypothetical protein PHY62_07225 [Gallionella sp.]|nr:hypothetical protein [Gallionella sp.]
MPSKQNIMSIAGECLIHYTPEANYFGVAGFEYSLQAPTGQSTTAHVELTLQNITVHSTGSISKTDGSTLTLADVTLAYSDEIQTLNADGSIDIVIKAPFAPSGENVSGTADKDLLLGNNGNTIIEALAGDDVVMIKQVVFADGMVWKGQRIAANDEVREGRRAA